MATARARRWTATGSWIALALLLLTTSPLRAAEYTIAPAPAWIAPIEPGVIDDALRPQVADGTYFLLSDVQTRIADGSRSQYRRYASTAVSPDGLAPIATLEIPFDPAYQRLVLHSIDVLRGGKRQPKLAGATIRILQREAELERRIYDGSKTASIFLEDVRVGDVVDYAYSVHGINPVFGGRDFGRLPLRFGVPVGRIHVRLLVPEAEGIALHARKTTLAPRVERVGALTSHAWDQRDVPALRYDDDEPGWYDATPVVEWSAFTDWSGVVDWAVPLYATQAPLAAALQDEVARIAREESTPTGRALAVLRFVQGEIRYLAVSIGTGSHAPRAPSQVFEKRFGDCKDKSLLMVAMLRALGVEAHAALVSTVARRGVADHLPSPGSFDHVVVRAQLDGKPAWFDPTQATQRADLAHLVQSDFDLALPIEPGVDALASMAPDGKPLQRHEVQTTFDARSGLDQPIAYTVVTHFRGERADSFRQTLSNTSREKLASDYLNFYAGYYPDIKVAQPFEVTDDASSNRITTTERYEIAGFATAADDAGRLQATIYAPDIEGQLSAPAEGVRSAPLWRPHPREVQVSTQVLLPEPWPLEDDRFVVEDAAFRYERVIDPDERGLVITDTYRSLKDEVPASEVVAMGANLARARNSVAYQLSWDGPDVVAAEGGLLDRINWMLLLIAVLVLAIWIWIALAGWRYDPAPMGVARPGAPRGLAGWLIVPGIGVVLSPIIIAYSLLSDLEVWSPASWNALTTVGGDTYHALWAPVMLIDLVFGIGAFVISLLLIALFFARRTSFPRLYVAFLVLLPLQTTFSYLLVSQVPEADVGVEEYSELAKTWLQSLVWSSYMLLAQRVKATFVVRRGANAAASTPPPLPVDGATPPPLPT